VNELGALALKGALTAAVVVAASLVAERSRPAVAALVLSLPVSAGPAYVLLALQHDAAFVARASLASLPVNVATVALVLGYAGVAHNGGGALASYGAGIAAWLATVALLAPVARTLDAAAALVASVFAAAIFATRRWREAIARPVVRRWYDVPIRAVFVGALVVAVVALSAAIGPVATGIWALFPVTYSSFMLLMHGRLGGPAVAAAMVNGLTMLVGFVVGLIALHLCASADRVTLGVVLFFAIPAAYALAALAWIKRRRARP
jgi:hypothetical protein